MSTFLTLFLKFDEASGQHYRTNISNTVFCMGGSIYSWNHKIV